MGAEPVGGRTERRISSVICPLCSGTGYLADAHPPRPCPGCQGCGWDYCCSGAPPRMAEFCDGHIDSPDCWCGPVQDQDEPLVWLHRDVPQH